MQLEAFQKAIVEGKNHIIQVREQKTAKTDGCAEIIVLHDVFKQLKTYVQQYRPVSSSDTWSGSPMDSGAVCHALSMELSHAGMEKSKIYMLLLKQLITF